MSIFSFPELYEALLTWYGRQSWWPADDAFEVMVGAILTQNTSWSNVEKALACLKQKITLNAENILSLSQEELETCLKPSGYFRVKTKRLQAYCRWYVVQGAYNGLQLLSTQNLRSLLLEINGVGRETADDILLYALERPVFVIDAYTLRLLQRLDMINGNDGYEEVRGLFENNLPKRVDIYKQFHALIIVHGKEHCRKSKPICETCRLRTRCAYFHDKIKMV